MTSALEEMRKATPQGVAFFLRLTIVDTFMAITGAQTGVSCSFNPSGAACPDKFGCIPGVCPDFTIKRHDTKPPFKVSVEDCDGPLDLADGTNAVVDPNLILEVNIWAKGRLK